LNGVLGHNKISLVTVEDKYYLRPTKKSREKMSALSENPTTVNFLSPLNFAFRIKRAPNINFFTQEITLPGILLPGTNYPNPFTNIPEPGDHLEYSDLSMSFKVNEDLSNYMEIHNWMRALGFPKEWAEYEAIQRKTKYSGEGIRSDISVMVLGSKVNPVCEFVFQDAFPVFLGGFVLSSAAGGIEYVTSSATFKYVKYEINFIV
jgi:hypothetical protein